MQPRTNLFRTTFLTLIFAISASLTLSAGAIAATLETETASLGFGSFGNVEKPVLRLFTSPDCRDCKRVEELLARLKLDFPQFKIVKRVSTETPKANSTNPRLTLFVPMRGNVFTKSNYHPDEATLIAFLKNRAAYLDERAKLSITLDAAIEALTIKSAPYEAALYAISEEMEAALKADYIALSQAEDELDKKQTPAERQATVANIQTLRKTIILKRAPFGKRIDDKQKEESDAVTEESERVSAAQQAVDDLDIKELGKSN